MYALPCGISGRWLLLPTILVFHPFTDIELSGKSVEEYIEDVMEINLRLFTLDSDWELLSYCVYLRSKVCTAVSWFACDALYVECISGIVHIIKCIICFHCFHVVSMPSFGRLRVLRTSASALTMLPKNENGRPAERTYLQVWVSWRLPQSMRGRSQAKTGISSNIQTLLSYIALLISSLIIPPLLISKLLIYDSEPPPLLNELFILCVPLTYF